MFLNFKFNCTPALDQNLGPRFWLPQTSDFGTMTTYNRWPICSPNQENLCCTQLQHSCASSNANTRGCSQADLTPFLGERSWRSMAIVFVIVLCSLAARRSLVLSGWLPSSFPLGPGNAIRLCASEEASGESSESDFVSVSCGASHREKGSV